MRRLLVLRPQPGADRTVARAAAGGLDAVAAPIFTIECLPWQMPDAGEFDAVMITSANALRCLGPGEEALFRLPCYAVGPSTAAAARDLGFTRTVAGPGDAEALLNRIESEGHRCLLHLCGENHVAADRPALRIERRILYAARPASRLPDAAAAAVRDGALVLLHSPRAADLFARLADEAGLERSDIDLAAISANAAAAAGSGWGSVQSAEAPRDEALLELAAKLCKTGAS